MQREQYERVIGYLVSGTPLFDKDEERFANLFEKYVESCDTHTLFLTKASIFFPQVSTFTTNELLREYWNKLLIAGYREKLDVKKENCLPPPSLGLFMKRFPLAG